MSYTVITKIALDVSDHELNSVKYCTGCIYGIIKCASQTMKLSKVTITEFMKPTTK